MFLQYHFLLNWVRFFFIKVLKVISSIKKKVLKVMLFSIVTFIKKILYDFITYNPVWPLGFSVYSQIVHVICNGLLNTVHVFAGSLLTELVPTFLDQSSEDNIDLKKRSSEGNVFLHYFLHKKILYDFITYNFV